MAWFIMLSKVGVNYSEVRGSIIYLEKYFFWFVLFWTLAVGCVLQLLILPQLPELHAGNGLLRGGDWVWFHETATDLAIQIRQTGWHVLTLRPRDNMPIAFAAVFYALTDMYSPLVVLPVNALLYATSLTIIFKIFSRIGPRVAIFAVAPLVFFPSTVTLYGQIHKDVVSIFGIVLLLNVLTELCCKRQFTLVGQSLMWMMSAFSLLTIWAARPYLVQVSVFAAGVGLVALLTFFFKKRSVSWGCTLVGVLTVFVFSLNVLSYKAPYRQLDVVATSSNKSVSFEQENKFKPADMELDAKTKAGEVSKDIGLRICAAFDIPVLMKYVAYIDFTRKGFNDSLGGTSIDTNIRFRSVCELLAYVPRALQIGLFAPFPEIWFSEGISPGGRVMRSISAVEMMISYILFLGVCLGSVLCKRNKAIFYVLLIVTMVMILINSLVVTNIGSLYRLRYISWQVINGLGVIGWYFFIKRSNLLMTIIWQKK
jgi:hypothetical protein